MTEDRAISLNAVIKAVDEHTNDDGTLDDDISCILEDLPPVTPSDEEMAMQYQRGFIDGFKEGKTTFEPKTGHWEWVQYDYNPKIGNWHCTECRCVVVECVDKNEKGGIPLYKYCPQCGTKMVEPQERSDKE